MSLGAFFVLGFITLKSGPLCWSYHGHIVAEDLEALRKSRAARHARLFLGSQDLEITIEELYPVVEGLDR